MSPRNADARLPDASEREGTGGTERVVRQVGHRMRPFASWDVHGHSGHTRATAFASLTHPKRRMEPIDDGDSRLRQTGLGERWRPADEVIGGHVRRGHVRPMLDRRRALDVRNADGDRRWLRDQKPPGAKVTCRREEILGRPGPHRTLSLVHVRCMAGGLGLMGSLCDAVLHFVHDRAAHSARDKRHEQEPDRNATTLRHESADRECENHGFY